MSEVDLACLSAGIKYSIESEHPDERSSRLRREECDARVRRAKDVGAFLAAMGVGAMVLFICASITISDAASADDKRWSMSILSSVAGGILGYVFRGAHSK